jgi:tRNA dimethylallyltransferase
VAGNLHDTAHSAIALLGPTAAGKTAAAIALAQACNGEIISIDSALVYRGLDIGSAKPTAAERAQVPHHLIDVRDPTEVYTANDFVSDARRLMAEIASRGRTPILAGGTMLYYKALRDGLADLPQADATLRAELDADARQLGWPALHARLATLDPVTAARLAPNDAQRIQRALEVCLLSGEPMSALLEAQKLEAQHASTTAGDASPEIFTIALRPEPDVVASRAVLHARIVARFDAMLHAGFLDEVQALRARGDLHPDLPAMRAVGYRQAWSFLDGEYDTATLRERAIAATRQLAKRQLTWLRSLQQQGRIDVVVNCLDPSAVALCAAQHLHAAGHIQPKTSPVRTA